MIYQPFRTVDAREEACEHNWPTFCSLPSQALARFCLTLFGVGLFCNHPGLFSLWAPLRCAASWKRMPTQMHVLHCQSGTQQLPAFWCKKKFPFAFFLDGLCPFASMWTVSTHCGFIFAHRFHYGLPCAHMTSNHHARTTGCACGWHPYSVSVMELNGHTLNKMDSVVSMALRSATHTRPRARI